MNSKELRQKRAKLVADAQALIPTDGNWTEELRTKFDKMMSDADAMKADIDRTEKAEALAKEMNSVERPPNDPINASGPKPNDDAETEHKSFRNFLRCGVADPELKESDIRSLAKRAGRSVYDFSHEATPHAWQGSEFRTKLMLSEIVNHMPAEYRDTFSNFMGVSAGSPVGTLGGYLVPQGFVYDIDVAMKFIANMLGSVTIMETATGNTMPYPTANDTSTVGELVGEGVQVSTADINIGKVTFGAYKFSTKLVPVTLELLQDSAFDIESFVKAAFAVRLARILNSYFTTGSGSSEPKGIITAATASSQTVIGDDNQTTPDPLTQVGYQDLVNLEHSVDPSYRPGAKFMLHDTTLKSLKLLKDKYGRPLWVPSLSSGTPETLVGYPYVINQGMDKVTQTSPVSDRNTVAFGALNKFIVRKVKELSVVRLVERYADYGIVGFLGFARYDSNLIDAGTNPVKYLTNPDA